MRVRLGFDRRQTTNGTSISPLCLLLTRRVLAFLFFPFCPPLSTLSLLYPTYASCFPISTGAAEKNETANRPCLGGLLKQPRILPAAAGSVPVSHLHTRLRYHPTLPLPSPYSSRGLFHHLTPHVCLLVRHDTSTGKLPLQYIPNDSSKQERPLGCHDIRASVCFMKIEFFWGIFAIISAG